MNVTLDRFVGLDGMVLLDCEFTCWEDSMRTRWADPARPPELIEIGLVCRGRGPGGAATFTSCVRPAVNPVLSDYCRSLTGIAQAEVDAAPDFSALMAAVGAWLGRDVVTCGWGPIDREFVTGEAVRRGVVDPFAGAPHADLHSLFAAALRRPPGTRDEVRARWGLCPNSGRHRALADAEDLAQFCALIERLAAKARA